MKKLGIIGGMGPAATARLFSRIVDFTDVRTDQEHVDVTMFNDPTIPDRTAFLLGKEGAKPFVPVLQEKARQLEELGCQVLAMPCNTSHSRLSQISEVLTTARFVNMIAETAAFMKAQGCSCVGIMATSGTVATRVYQDALEAQGLQACIPSEQGQEHVMSVIYDYVKAGKQVPEGLFEGVCDELLELGCDGLLLGCTELSLLGMPARYGSAIVVDALDVLAWRAVQECGAPAHDLAAQYQ